MLLEAANGNAAKEILRALNISRDALPDLRTGFKVYCDTFEVSDCVNKSVSLSVSISDITIGYF
jgi:glycerol kinase